MPLLESSFRGRLRLFFAVIVIVPVIAVGAVLFRLLDVSENLKLDSQLGQAQKTAQNLYGQQRGDAARALRQVQGDVGLATAIREKNRAQLKLLLSRLARQAGLEEVELEITGFGKFHEGSNVAIAGAQADVAN